MERVDPGTNGKGKRAKGRMEPDKQEKVIEHDVIKKRIDQLVRLKNAADEAGEEFSEAVKKAAEDSGLLASSVRSFVTARAGENFEEAKRKCEQLSLLFDEVGE